MESGREGREEGKERGEEGERRYLFLSRCCVSATSKGKRVDTWNIISIVFVFVLFFEKRKEKKKKEGERAQTDIRILCVKTIFTCCVSVKRRGEE